MLMSFAACNGSQRQQQQLKMTRFLPRLSPSSSYFWGSIIKTRNHQPLVAVQRQFVVKAQNCDHQNDDSAATSKRRKSDKPYLYEDGREFKPVRIEQFEQLYKNRPKIKSNIEQILNKYELEKYTTTHVPTTLSMENMRSLLKVYGDEQELQKTMKFFYTRECDRYNSRRKKFYKQQLIKEKKLEKYGPPPTSTEGSNDDSGWNQGVFGPDGELVYGLWHNSLLSRITKQTVRDYRQNHLLRLASMFGQKLIIDLDYDRYMKPSEINLLAQQVGILYYENRCNREYPNELPYDIHFTNCSQASQSLNSLSKHIKRMDQLMDYYFHPQSYLDRPDLFPLKNLVYLSPHAREPLRTYSHDDIYILGGYNDRTTHLQATHVKAQSEGIRCYRLPLDENVLWKKGNKNLCLNQVMAILHSVKATNDWQLAIRKFAPQRKVRSVEEQDLEDQIRLKAMARRMKTIQRSYRL